MRARRARARRRHERRTGANEIARRSRGTPRIANRLLRRVRDFAVVDGAADRRRARSPTRRCALLDVDAIGLDQHGPQATSTLIARQLRRRPGRHRDHRGGAVRAARRHRGHHRALPDPAGLPAAHAARPRADAARLPPSRPGRAERATPAAQYRAVPRGTRIESRGERPLPISRRRRTSRGLPPLRAARGRHAHPAGPRLLRGHGLLRRRLSRQLPALPGARAHRLPAAAGVDQSDAPRRTATGSSSPCGA